MIVLAGDVGGTRTRLGLFEIENRNFKTLAFERYQTRKFRNLGQIVNTFLKTEKMVPRAAAFGIAGPVIDGVCRATNMPWVIDVAKLSKRIGIPRTTIVNDFVANAHGISALRPNDLYVLQRGEPDALRNKAVIGPGTGLGQAIIASRGGTATIVASEGGHDEFGPQNERQIELLEFLKRKFGHVSYERICSGPGILNVYEFIKSMKYAKESELVKKALKERGADKPKVIIKHANKDKLCKITANMVFGILGAEAGNLALQAMAIGGVYLVGSIIREDLKIIKKSPFKKMFNQKGRFTKLTNKIPVYVVKKEQLGILGAAALASQLF